ncbi:MAG: hypothetical protein WBH09_09540 [Rugosibacter sp.]
MRNFLPTFSPVYASAMRREFLRLSGFCALSPVAQATAFRSAAVSPAPTFFAVRRFVRFIQPAPNPPCIKLARSHLKTTKLLKNQIRNLLASAAAVFSLLCFFHAPEVHL